jgi:hypothetical protein
MNPTTTSVDITEDERLERLAEVFAGAVAKSMSEQTTPVTTANKYITFGQGILGIIATLIAFCGMGFTYTLGVQSQLDSGKERSTKLEYQVQILTTDNTELRTHQDRTDTQLNDMNSRLVRVDTNVLTLLSKQNK